MADLASLKAEVAALAAKVDANKNSINFEWTAVAIVLVFWMHAGFSMLEAGSIRLKNVQNILFKNMLNVVITTVTWWFWGYAFAFGKSSTKGWIGGGTAGFYAGKAVDDYFKWTFQWAFAATAVTIISGGMAERANTKGYILMIVFFQLIIYPVVCHWVWADGWLATGNGGDSGVGFKDFAGSAVVHMVGGISAFIGVWFLGKRNGYPNASNVTNVVLGTFILWMGWYGFNGGSGAIAGFEGESNTISHVYVNTTIAASVAGIGTLLLFFITKKRFLVAEMCNGILGGLVAITACCDMVEDWAAFVIGLIAVFFYYLGHVILCKLDMDDAIGAFPVHGMCGIWGILATGLFRTDVGWFYNSTTCMAWQVYGILAITGWIVVLLTPFLFILKKINLLRIDEDTERIGLDTIYHARKSLMVAPAGVDA